jgi:hypothetical protein
MPRAFGTLGVYSMVTLGKLTSYKENEEKKEGKRWNDES